MGAGLLIALQAAAAAPPPGLPNIDFDLAQVPRSGPAEGCRRRPGDDILICGRRDARGAYPLDEMEALFMPRPIRADMALPGGATASVRLQQVELDRGAVSNRVLFHIRWPF